MPAVENYLDLLKSILHINHMQSSKLLAVLCSLSPRQFERFVAEIWEKHQGWNTEVSKEGADGGIDILGESPDGIKKTAVQCKKYRNKNVSSSDVREYASISQRDEDIDGVTIITTSSFTQPARDEASKLGVRLFNGDKLLELIDEVDAYDALAWYAAGEPEY
jgi:restriction system protein